MKFSRLIIALLLVYSVITSYMLYDAAQIKKKVKQARILESENSKKIANLKKSRVNIIINAAPKSGSAYIAASLERGLEYDHFRISGEYIPHDQINFTLISQFYEQGSKLSKQHMDPSRINLQILKRFTDKMVLVMRDPREILLSWVHHLNREKAANADLFYIDPEPPASYFELSLSEQIDWNITHFLPEIVSWMNNWTNIKHLEDAKPDGLKILAVTYNELTKNEAQLFHKILSFYAIPTNDFRLLPPEKNDRVHFRKGDSNEWRQVYTAEQLKRINALVPDTLLAQYGWKR